MACHFPIPAYLGHDGAIKFARRDAVAGKRGLVHLPCGMCRGCKADRAREWAIRCYHESQMHRVSTFINPTYAPDKLPPHGTLDPRDLQLFFKRLRKATGVRFRYFACGEYGEKRGRPHYHICMFGYAPPRDRVGGRSDTGQILWHSDLLHEIWGLGHILFAEFTPSAARYTAHYTADKLKKYALDEIDSETGLKPYERRDPITGEIHQLVHEFQRQSLRPGIGIPWLEKNWREIFPADSVVMDGKEYPVPKIYFQWLKKHQPDVFKIVKAKRLEYCQDRPYITGHRLHQMETCRSRSLDQLVRPTHKEKS